MSVNPEWPAYDLYAVVPHDTNNLIDVARQLYVGTDGNVVVETEAGTTVTFSNVIGGSTLGPFFVKKVKATGTTSSNIVAFV